MKAITATIADDRGKQVEVGLSRWQHAASGNADEDRPLWDLVGAVESKIQPAWMTGKVDAVFLLGMALAALLTVLIATVVFGTRLPSWLFPVITTPVLLGASILWKRRALPRNREIIVSTFCAEARCPSCANSVAGCPVDSDGCVVCPECGAAWKSDRIKSADRGVGERSERNNARSADRRPRMHVLDATGRIVPIRHPALRGLSLARRKEIGSDRIKDVRERVVGIKWWSRLIVATLLIVVAVTVGIGVMPMVRATPPMTASNAWVVLRPMGMAVLSLVLLGGSVAMLRNPVGVLPERVAEVHLALGLCPCCAADLAARGSRVAGSTHVRCPDCRAEWAGTGEATRALGSG